jgi:hypothetical protein
MVLSKINFKFDRRDQLSGRSPTDRLPPQLRFKTAHCQLFIPLV